MKPCKGWIKTMTYDNDMAFTKHQMINEVLGTKSFFTHPLLHKIKALSKIGLG